MSDYDAFGRKTDEDTMSDLGWGSSGEPPPPVEVSSSPSVTSSPTSPAADWSPAQPSATGAPRVPRRRSGGPSFRPVLWGVEAIILLAVVFGIWRAVEAGNDAVDSVRDGFKPFTEQTQRQQQGGVPGSGSGDGEGDTPPSQVQARKLLTPDGLQEALKVMERATPGKVQNLRLDPKSISYQVQKGSKFTIASLYADGEAPDVAVTQRRTPVPGGIPFDAVDVGAPARIIRAAGARLNQPRSKVNYLVLQDLSGSVRWIVYFMNGRYAIGNERGQVTQVY